MRLDRKFGKKKRKGRFFTLRIFAGLLVFLGGILLIGMPKCYGKEHQDFEEGLPNVYENPDTGYRALIEDQAELLTKGDCQRLLESMKKITAYGNTAFLTTNTNSGSTEKFARDSYRRLFGTDSGTVFVIDMDNRNIWIFSDGAVYKVITKAYANTITDNVYRYASKEDYYYCAAEAFYEINKLLEGQKIGRPMKYISNALLAMILSLLANFGLIIVFTRLRKPREDVTLAHIHRKLVYSNIVGTYSYQTKIYDPVSHGSSEGGGGGGRSGGGSSGGGGGHGF